MQEVIREVLIKECGDMLHDRVIIVENLPKKFLYDRTVRMMQRIDRDGWSDGTLLPDPDREMEDTLHPGLEFSQTGDGAIMFWRGNQESAQRLKDIDRYIEGTLPRDVRIPKRVEYAQQIGNPSAGPIPLFQIPRVSLPLEQGSVAVSLPPAPKLKIRAKTNGLILPETVQPTEEPVLKSKQAKKGWSDERRLAARERMQKMLAEHRKKKAVAA